MCEPFSEALVTAKKLCLLHSSDPSAWLSLAKICDSSLTAVTALSSTCSRCSHSEHAAHVTSTGSTSGVDVQSGDAGNACRHGEDGNSCCAVQNHEQAVHKTKNTAAVPIDGKTVQIESGAVQMHMENLNTVMQRCSCRVQSHKECESNRTSNDLFSSECAQLRRCQLTSLLKAR